MSAQSRNGLVFSQSDIVVVARIRRIAVSDVDVNGLMHMRTEDGTILLNELQRVLDTSRSGQAPLSFASSKVLRKFRGRAIRLLVKLARHYAIFPETTVVDGIECNRGRDPAFHGGFADIFQGTLEDAVVAMKRIRAYTSDEETRRVQDMLRKEAMLWRQLDHPHILPFLGIDTKTFTPLYTLVSPWMKNGNLLQFVARDKSAPSQINLLVAETARGLQYLHKLGIAHGDLRAANVLINDTHQACLADFGLARLLSIGSAPVSSRAHETSARWLAPELLAEDEITVTFEGDVFAFGRVCLEAYTLKMPFWYIQREATVIKKILAGEEVRRPTSRETGCQDLSDNMWQILELCWATAPYKRPSVTQLIALLEGVTAKSPVVQTLQISARPVHGHEKSGRPARPSDTRLIALLKRELKREYFTPSLYAKPAQGNRVCNQCSAPENPSRPRFRICGGCFAFRYCSLDCQRNHWVRHRAACQHMAEQTNATEQINAANLAKHFRKFTSTHKSLLEWVGFQALQLHRVPSNVHAYALVVQVAYQTNLAVEPLRRFYVSRTSLVPRSSIVNMDPIVADDIAQRHERSRRAGGVGALVVLIQCSNISQVMPVEVDALGTITWDARPDWEDILREFVADGRPDFKPISSSTNGIYYG